MNKNREFDIVVFGATGYTGRLVAEYLYERYGDNGEIKWALAGRSISKLEKVRTELGLSDEVSLLVVDANSMESLESMVVNTSVVLTTVGPYQLYGSELVKACAHAGTDYVDLCGEVSWMRDMIDAHSAAAKASGARIVFSCGFDSLPFDLGVFFLQQEAQKRFGRPLPRVKSRVRSMKGSFSGGTLAAFKANMAAADKDSDVAEMLSNLFALTPGFNGSEPPDYRSAQFDQDIDCWVAPFIMAATNMKNVHRSNLLLGHQYGKELVYDEMLVTGQGEKGEARAKAATAAVIDNNFVSAETRQPGEGPTLEERKSGFFDVLFLGVCPEGKTVHASVKGNEDPGYGSTSKMIAESAVCLLKNPEMASGGIWTPASALGMKLIERLHENTGMKFEIETV